VLALWQLLRTRHPFVVLKHFTERSFSLGCALSFVFGMGLYGSVYLLSIFLGAVRGHSPLEIGEIMVVSGAAQLLMAPIAAAIEPRVDPRLLTAVGFGVFGVGLAANGFETIHTDFAQLFWPQVLRGLGVMLCILPTTRMALATVPEEDVADASALFNLMRNLGGAIGIAVVDTILERRTAGHFMDLALRLKGGDATAAAFVGLPTGLFKGHDMGPVDPIMKAMIEPLIKKAALTISFNEAWFVVAALFAVSLVALPFIRRTPPAQSMLHGMG
jgi:DHA2 family multidrug resistance protein